MSHRLLTAALLAAALLPAPARADATFSGCKATTGKGPKEILVACGNVLASMSSWEASPQAAVGAYFANAEQEFGPDLSRETTPQGDDLLVTFAGPDYIETVEATSLSSGGTLMNTCAVAGRVDAAGIDRCSQILTALELGPPDLAQLQVVVASQMEQHLSSVGATRRLGFRPGANEDWSARAAAAASAAPATKAAAPAAAAWKPGDDPFLRCKGVVDLKSADTQYVCKEDRILTGHGLRPNMTPEAAVLQYLDQFDTDFGEKAKREKVTLDFSGETVEAWRHSLYDGDQLSFEGHVIPVQFEQAIHLIQCSVVLEVSERSRTRCKAILEHYLINVNGPVLGIEFIKPEDVATELASAVEAPKPAATPTKTAPARTSPPPAPKKQVDSFKIEPSKPKEKKPKDEPAKEKEFSLRSSPRDHDEYMSSWIELGARSLEAPVAKGLGGVVSIDSQYADVEDFLGLAAGLGGSAGYVVGAGPWLDANLGLGLGLRLGPITFAPTVVGGFDGLGLFVEDPAMHKEDFAFYGGVCGRTQITFGDSVALEGSLLMVRRTAGNEEARLTVRLMLGDYSLAAVAHDWGRGTARMYGLNIAAGTFN